MTPPIRTRAAAVAVTTAVALLLSPASANAQPADRLGGSSAAVAELFSAIRGQIAALVGGSSQQEPPPDRIYPPIRDPRLPIDPPITYLGA